MPIDDAAGPAATAQPDGIAAASAHRGPDHHAIALAASALAGVLGSLQGRMNGELTVLTGEPVETALWNVLSGLLVLSLLVVSVRPVRRGLGAVAQAVRTGSLRWWQLVGGLSGGLFLAAQSYAVPLLGVALFTVAAVAGQTGNGLVVDRFGIGPGGPKPIHWGRMLAAALAIVGVAISVSPRLGGQGVVLLPVVLSLLVGGLAAAQVGVNGRVNLVSQQVLSTTWINFTMGALMLLVITLGRWVGHAWHPEVPHGVPWWAWWGGLCGMGFIATAAWAVKHLGVLVFGLALLTGQLSAAVALDLLNPATRGDVTGPVVIGVLVTFAAAALASWFARRERVKPA